MSQSFDFDTYTERRGTSAKKWTRYGDDVLPFWVADMDFRTPQFLLDAVADRLAHGIMGYTYAPPELDEAFLGWVERTYGWQPHPAWLEWIPGVVQGFNLAAQACAAPGGAILMNTPVYYPFLAVPQHARQQGIEVPLVLDSGRWVIDFDAMEAAVTPATRLLLACNPQNPTGRVYTREELTELAEFVLRHDLVICSDEIHSAIILEPGAEHIPIASLGPEIAARSITLMAATKTYNIPGLSCAAAIIPDAALRNRFLDERRDLVGGVSPLAFTASTAAFSDTSSWVPELTTYLRGNRDLLAQAMGERMTNVEATYLGWIDVRDLALDNPEAHFLAAGLGMSIGEQFHGPGFIRFNFACPRSTLDQGLERLQAALTKA